METIEKIIILAILVTAVFTIGMLEFVERPYITPTKQSLPIIGNAPTPKNSQGK